jgi:diguanylate cyclase (GGDEF)-like protein
MAAPGFGKASDPEIPVLTVDSLTGLIRGSTFEALARETLATADADAQGPAILVVGMDRFRRLNALLGYEAGDRALAAIGKRLQQAAGPNRTIARLGGDEFAILMPSPLRHETAVAFAITLLHAIEAPIMLGGREVFLSASIGVAYFPNNGETAPDLLRGAASALEKAKLRGGNSVESLPAPRMLSPEARFELENQLRQALSMDEFTLRFQPQVDREGSLVGMEALLNWNNRLLGRVDTQTFIKLAEEIGQIGAIGQWVFESACAHIREWKQSGLKPPRVAVNVSPIQFTDPAFVDKVEQTLKETDTPGECLEIEVTENAVLADIEDSARKMSRLRSLGVSIAIDDFGVGYSPLSYLHRLPLDSVKVDRSFVGNITKPMGSLPVLHTISVMAHNRGLKVVAEGIETAAELELVQAARFDRMQGYLFATPLTRPEIESVMRDPEPLSRPFHSSSSHGILF